MKELNDLPEWAGPLHVGGKIRGSRGEHPGGKMSAARCSSRGPVIFTSGTPMKREAVGKTVRPRVVRTGRRGFSAGRE